MHRRNDSQLSAACRSFFDWVTASPNDFTVVRPFHTAASDPRSRWDVDKNPFWARDPREGAPKYHAWGKADQGEVGAFLHGYDSLWCLRRCCEKSAGDNSPTPCSRPAATSWCACT
jgi:hypothetical protein